VICPDCGAEYRPGFTRCSDCDVPLVERAAQEFKASQRSLSPVVGWFRRYLPDIVALAVLLLASHYLPRPLVLCCLLLYVIVRLVEGRRSLRLWGLPRVLAVAAVFLMPEYFPGSSGWLTLGIVILLALRLLVQERLWAREEEKEWTRVRPRGWTR
jgi:hypothetical protein